MVILGLFCATVFVYDQGLVVRQTLHQWVLLDLF